MNSLNKRFFLGTVPMSGCRDSWSNPCWLQHHLSFW